MSALHLASWGAAILFSKVTVTYYTPTSCVWSFWFLHILINTYYCLFGDTSLVSEVASHCGFGVGSSDGLMTLSIFPYACWPFVSSLGKCLFRSFALFYSSSSFLSSSFSFYVWETYCHLISTVRLAALRTPFVM